MNLNATNITLPVSDIITLHANVTGFNISDLSLSKNFKLMQLMDDEFIFGLKNLTGSFLANYEFVTDPPILADIGELNVTIGNNTI